MKIYKTVNTIFKTQQIQAKKPILLNETIEIIIPKT